MSRSHIPLKTSATFLVLLVCAIVVYGSMLYIRRPLFHDYLTVGEMGFTPYWQPTMGLYDEGGTYAFFDFRNNTIVVIETDEPGGSLNYRPLGTNTHAILLSGSGFEYHTGRRSNTLVIVDVNKQEKVTRLPDGRARIVYFQLCDESRSHPFDLLSEVVKRCR